MLKFISDPTYYYWLAGICVAGFIAGFCSSPQGRSFYIPFRETFIAVALSTLVWVSLIVTTRYRLAATGFALLVGVLIIGNIGYHLQAILQKIFYRRYRTR